MYELFRNLCDTNTVKVTWQLFKGKFGNPSVFFVQVQAGTCIEPLTFRKLAEVYCRIRTYPFKCYHDTFTCDIHLL